MTRKTVIAEILITGFGLSDDTTALLPMLNSVFIYWLLQSPLPQLP